MVAYPRTAAVTNPHVRYPIKSLNTAVPSEIKRGLSADSPPAKWPLMAWQKPIYIMPPMPPMPSMPPPGIGGGVSSGTSVMRASVVRIMAAIKAGEREITVAPLAFSLPKYVRASGISWPNCPPNYYKVDRIIESRHPGS